MFHHQCTVLFFTIFLVFAVQCTRPSRSPSDIEGVRLGRSRPSPAPNSGLSTHCNFKCPDKDMAGFSLGSDSAADRGRLHCTYPMSETSGARFRCEYHKVSKIFQLCSSSPPLNLTHTHVLLLYSTRENSSAIRTTRIVMKQLNSPVLELEMGNVLLSLTRCSQLARETFLRL
jgi:hypothetical protein